MHHDMLFWIMLIVVSAAVTTGALSGVGLTPPRSIVACLLAAATVSAGVTIWIASLGLEGGGPLVAIATFMFFSVIATALSLLVSRLKRARRASGSD